MSVAAPTLIDCADLPEAVQSQIRHRCGYGCVRCGVTIYSFCQFPVDDEPGWSAPAIVLLCQTCLRTLTAHPLERAQYAALLKRPIARDPQFIRHQLPYYPAMPRLRVGGAALVRNTSIPVMIGGYAPIGFAPPINANGATLITLTLMTAKGIPEPIIHANIWSPPDDSWQFHHLGGRYIVESDASASRAEIEISAPDCITIVHIVSEVGDRKIEMTENWVEIDGKRMTNLIASGHLVGLIA